MIMLIGKSRFGPNTFPAHNSVIFASEVQVDYIAKTLFLPLLDGKASSVEVKAEAEEDFVADIDEELRGTVFSAGCSNWYINSEGRNSASWPGLAATFWRRTFFPKWSDFVMGGGHKSWRLKRTYRSMSSLLFSKMGLLVLLAVFGAWADEQGFRQTLQAALAQVS